MLRWRCPRGLATSGYPLTPWSCYLYTRTQRLTRVVPGGDRSWILGPGGVARTDSPKSLVDDLTDSDWQTLSESGLLDDGFSDWYGVTQVITTACNLRCHYCFQNTVTKGKASRIQRIPSRTMTPDILRKSLDFVASRMDLIGAQRVALTLFGGEPTLNLEQCAHTLYEYSKRFQTVEAMMVTNGFSLEGGAILRLEEAGLDRIQVTLDGTQEHHDRARVSRAITNTFDQILANIDQALTMTGINVAVRVNLTPENASSIHELLSQLSMRPGMLTDRVGLDLAPVRGYPWNRAIVGNSSAEDVIIDAFKYARTLGFRVAAPEVRACIHCTYLNAERGVVIGPSGELYSNWSAVGRLSHRVGTLDEGVTAPAAKWQSCMEFDGAEGVGSHELSDSDRYIAAALGELYGN